METNPGAALHSPNSDEVEFEFELLPFRKYKDGRIERLDGEEFVAPSDDLDGISSKDVVIDPTIGISARLYVPLAVLEQSREESAQRLPVLIYYHGGGYCVETPFSPLYHPYQNSLASKGKIIIVSVHYRRATEHLLPAAYDDCWAALLWVLSHEGGDGPDPWLNAHADLGRVYLAGDSAGGNITHNVAMRFGEEMVRRGKPALEGIILVQPHFWGTEKLPEELKKIKPEWLAAIDKVWHMVSGLEMDHPWLNATADTAPSLAKLGCRRVLVAVAGEDVVRPRGLLYYDTLRRSGWAGTAEIWETPGEPHVFHLFNPTTEKAKEMMDKFVSFFNGV